ncbi:hypothetical protein [Paenibacillus dakarensis]|uniref:hypothetical protein n=1 Tax=Paenibacillus dakarensis TaxID=1527293 RepID=UPI0012E30151|nr:hypothetical protein [Paenibacillus dakarensis]
MTKSGFKFEAGEIITVHPGANIREGFIAFADGEYGTGGGEFRVLEPIKSAPLSAQPPLDQVAATISALQTQIKALESRVTALEKKPAKVVASGPVDDALPSFAIPRAKTPQQLRDEIVERAKADVKALLDRNYYFGYNPTIWFTDRDGSSITDKCDFIVNRDKRTVVALISVIDGKPFRKGVAKCAPNDVFNAHIGRAIALRRALGLEVPAEYLRVPNPEEPRVGDVVFCHGLGDVFSLTGTLTKRAEEFDGSHFGENAFYWSKGGWIADKQYRIIEDSREEVAK